MSVIPPEERQLQALNLKIEKTNEKLDRIIELLGAMNGNLTSIKANTTRPIMRP
jgi:hypothetical protein